jgi:hypothetical protein
VFGWYSIYWAGCWDGTQDIEQGVVLALKILGRVYGTQYIGQGVRMVLKILGRVLGSCSRYWAGSCDGTQNIGQGIGSYSRYWAGCWGRTPDIGQGGMVVLKIVYTVNIGTRICAKKATFLVTI